MLQFNWQNHLDMSQTESISAHTTPFIYLFCKVFKGHQKEHIICEKLLLFHCIEIAI